MILVDSSVWIDYFNGVRSAQTDRLDELAGVEPLALGDLILAEVLQGFRADDDFARARDLLLEFTVFPLLGAEMALRCAENYRVLRKRGITVRKTADVIIASFCIAEGHRLLFADRDFVPFVEVLGLRPA
ncbi:MAG TPA: PIN domain nuclease [Lacisediminihabitans sp.]|uniref:type II toxin-antitoxin system VapC family toxin n=1 Tax=Lacisediminihabitans sp. TaxID=2787631 RepID=UPI002EDB13E2